MSSLTATELRPKLTGQRTHRGRVWFALYLVFLFVTFAGLGTAHDDFPLGFHPDEPSKVVQLESGQFNFYHPQLMLSLTRAGVAVTGADTAQQMVEVGRTVSALLSAGAVVALTLAVAMLFGYLPAVAAGLLLLQSYPLLTAAHYMKEDPALLFGMSVTMVAVIWFWRSPSRWRAVLLGAAAALAVSGKYIGAVMIPVAVFTIWVATQEDRRAMRKPLLLSAAGGFAAILLLCNGSALLQLRSAVRGLGREVFHSVSGHEGTLPDVFEFYYVQMLPHELGWAVLAAALVGIAIFIARWRELDWPARLFLVLPLLFFVIISAALIQSPRYMIPVVVWLCAIAGVGVVWVVEYVLRLKPAHVWIAIPVVVLLALPGAIRCLNYQQQFANDSRIRLARWLSENLDASAHVIQDKHAAVNRVTMYALPFEVETRNPSVGDGGAEELAAMGYTHIITCKATYRRYFSSHIRASAEFREEFEQIRARYEQVWRDCELLWESKPDYDIGAYTNPEIRLYRLPSLDADDHPTLIQPIHAQ